MRFNQKQIVTAGDMSADISSIGIDTQQLAIGSVQLVWTGSSPVGNFTVQVSNDIVAVSTGTDPAAGVTTWTTYTGSSQATGGAAGNFMYEISDIGSRWIRIKYTFTSGSGTLNATFFGKGP